MEAQLYARVQAWITLASKASKGIVLSGGFFDTPTQHDIYKYVWYMIVMTYLKYASINYIHMYSGA